MTDSKSTHGRKFEAHEEFPSMTNEQVWTIQSYLNQIEKSASGPIFQGGDFTEAMGFEDALKSYVNSLLAAKDAEIERLKAMIEENDK